MNEINEKNELTKQTKEATSLSYVLITPARNEEAFIELTIKSVIAQTVLPIKWVIVSDGSTDGTDDIVKKYAAEHPWIELVRMPERTERHFAGKVHAFNAGYAKVRNLNYDIIGNLDADITLDKDHLSFLLGKFAENTKLGIAGTPFREGTVQYDYRVTRKEHVSGACLLFRRECFDAIAGYVPLRMGGEDVVATITARMKGWKTETFTEKYSMHHRQMGTAKERIFIALFKSGYYDYPLGVHPVWQISRSIYQMSRAPYIVGGSLLLAGYLWAMLTRAQMPVSMEFVQFRRDEQMRWLKEYFRKGLLLLKC